MTRTKCAKERNAGLAPRYLCDSVWPLISNQCCPQNFAKMQLSEIEDNIVSRRNRIFLLMEEVRRLRIQRRLKVKAPTQVPL